MIPLRDDVPARTYPVVNVSLIVLNVLFFLWELSLGPALEPALMKLAVVPALFSGGDGVLGPFDIVVTALDPSFASRTFFSMFLHGGLAHIIGNMLYLWIFGDNVEDRLGHGRYLVFYLLSGWLASYAHIFFDAASALPAVGASGAIAGVLGAYFLLYPHARVVIAWPPPLLFFLPLMQVPALIVLGLWFLQQFLFGLGSLGAGGEEGGVAFWAHAGGFVAGMVLVRLFARKERRPVARDYWWEAPRYQRKFDRRSPFP
jgi:membrane associated rhomboid family serine protease